MSVTWITAFLDTPRESSQDTEAFWRAVTATTASVRRGDDQQFVTLCPVEGDAFLRAQVTGDSCPGVHLDLHVTDVAEAARRAQTLGAAVLVDHDTLVVLRSPGGMPLCLVVGGGERVRPQPVSWPGGHHSLLDQVCLDAAADGFDAEADFWSALTGWVRRRGSSPEFDRPTGPREMPLRAVLQRVGGSGRTRAHLDLACDDVPAEVARHRSLGATVVGTTSAWTTLRDPSHREYRITARDPRTGASSSLASAGVE